MAAAKKKKAEAKKAAAPEVAAQGPKSSNRPDGALAHELNSTEGVPRDIYNTALDVRDRNRADDRQYLQDLTAKALEDLKARAVGADKETQQRLRAQAELITGVVEQTLSHATDPAGKAVHDLLAKGPTELKNVMSAVVENTGNSFLHALARGVSKVAADVMVGTANDKHMGGAQGYYSGERNSVMMLEGVKAPLHTMMHEAVHAATVKGLLANKNLYNAAAALLEHAIARDAGMSSRYAGTNVMEFVAEGMTNPYVQERLKALPASERAQGLLGRAATAWAEFVNIARRALGLDAKHTSALSQLIDISAAAMRETKDSKLSMDELATRWKQQNESGRLENRLGPEGSLDDRLTSLLTERGFKVDQAAFEGVPSELRVDLIRRTIQADPSQPMSQDVAKVVSWMTVGSDFYQQIHQGIQGTKLEREILTEVNKDKRQSLYTPSRKRQEVVRRAVEQLLTNGLNKKYAGEAPLPARVMELVRSAVRSVMEGLGAIKYKELQGLADQYINDLLAGREKLERPKVPNAVRMDPASAFAADQHAADLTYALTSGRGFALTGSLAYAAQGTVYRQEGAAIHDLDFVTNMSQQRAEGQLERLYPHATKVRSFGGMGEFVSTYIVPPRGYTATLVGGAENGVIKAYVVRDDKGAVAGRYYVTNKGETSTGVKATVVDLISEPDMKTDRMTIPTSFGERKVPIVPAAQAMAQKLLYAREKDIRDFANFVPSSTEARKFNEQKVNEDPAPSEKDVADAKEYLNRVLGKQIKAEFKKFTDFSGEWIDAENVVRVSTITSAGVMNVARHEALHAFFSKFIKSNPRAVRVLKTLTDDPKLMRRLEILLADEPAALQQLADGEERLAYIYQFAMAGVLKLPHTPGTTLMAKVRRFLRSVFGMVSDQERASSLLYAFEAGKMNEPSAAARAINKELQRGLGLARMSKSLDGIAQRAAALTVPSETIMANSASPTIRKIGRMFYTNPGAGGLEDGRHGYLNDRNQMMRRYDNLFRGTINGLDDRQMSSLIEAMQNETPLDEIKDPDVAEAQQKLTMMFARFHRYMTDEKGLEIGKIKANYFPVVWDSAGIGEDPSAFKAMLGAPKYAGTIASMAQDWSKKQAAFYNRMSEAEIAQMGPPDTIDAAYVIDELTKRVSRGSGVMDDDIRTPQRMDGVLRPWMAAGEERTLNFLDPEDRAPFLEKNLVTTLSRYVRQGVRAAEYGSRFGRDGEILDKMLEQAHDELKAEGNRLMAEGDLKDEKARDDWVRRQFRDASNAAGAMEGSLGSDVSPTVRKINSWAIVYQNVRLLPLALFSSFVDPLGIVARGGEMREAWEAFTSGIQGVARQWGDMIREEPAQRQKTEWETLAENAGVIGAAVFSHLISDEYGSVFLDGKTKKINETMFKLNGMEPWNRAMRVAATKSAVNFIEKHLNNPTKHSERWLDELGLGKMDVPLDADGRLVTDRRVLSALRPEMTLQEAELMTSKVHSAIVRWVEGAILSPNAAQRPAWGSDPHYSMFWHLKQFAYSFHQTMMRRGMNEAAHGNMMPLGVFAWYIPVMIAADVTKGLMLGAGSLPPYMKGYDLGDWMMHGVDRAGLLGPGQIAIDAVQHPTSLGGPMFEQIPDLFTQPVEESLVRALPVNSLYARAVLN